ncbi:hypothetical protein FGIG_04415 [Fasciola gigantica]|uniref:Neurotransmitter-gated ion-channel ligand-binding domain-containing protein n=1 Tax=Fasciola gigantica TaxID=46835 RepID=A0A504YYI7_FASGI|nr:hypothetical protein FGIG_04415 [Fasciola gigantica]
MSFGIFIILSCISIRQAVQATTDPELLEQLWIQLYRFLPGPSVSPQLPSELSISVNVAVSVDNVELLRSHNGPACRASLTILAEWPVTDARVADSRLVELMNGAVRLDVNRVWHPELVIPGSYRVQTLAQRLELRADVGTPEGSTTGPKPPSAMARSSLMGKGLATGSGRIQSNFQSRESSDEAQKPIGRVSTRINSHKLTGSSEGPRYVYVESLAAEFTCNQPKKLSQVAAVLCPIFIRQGGLMHVQPSLKWAERKSCLIAENVERRISHITVTKLFGQHIDRQGADHSLGVNICFPQTTRIVLYSLAPVLIVLVSLLILWNGPIGAHVVTWFHLTLLLTTTGLWIWLSGQEIGMNGQPGLVDIWLLICVVSVSLTSCLAVLEQRWSDRVLRQRQRRCLRTPSLSLLQNKAAAVPGTPALNVNPTLSAGCFQGCACGGSNSGTCPENCVNCAGLQARASGGFVSTNGTSGVYCSNGSCGASGHVCSGMGTHGQGNSSSNSPAPMGFSLQPLGMGTTKLDTYNDGFLCSNTTETRNGGPGGAFRGLRWRNMSTSRRTHGHNNTGLTGVELPDCQACLCHPASAQAAVQQGSPAPPYTSACSSVSSHVPANCCLKILKTALTVSFFLIGAVFWITVLALGTVPEACLGASVCQPVTTAYLK